MLKYLLFASSCLGITMQAKAEVTLESQTKISDYGLHFDGADLDYNNVANPDTGEKYDFFFGRNISAHGDAVKTYKQYVFVTWYKGGKNERNVMLSRYNTETGSVKTIEFPHRHTGFRGDPLVGESHNTIGLAVSPVNGSIHMVFDMHAYDNSNHGGKFKDDFFRYSYSIPGAAEVSDDAFTIDQFVKDTSSVSQGPDDYKHLTMTGSLDDKSNFARLTYPKFFTNTDGTLLLYMRLGGNNNGAYVFNRYDAAAQKWSTFTNFNSNNQLSKGNDYNWGLYGNMKYVNGKLRVGFQQRSGDNDDRYKYQNGIFYATSDHPEGVGEWKNHQGEPMTWPLVNSDEIKVLEPGDYIDHTEANSVYIVGSFDWTVTAKGDIHFISKVRSTDKNRPDYQEVYLHSYKPAGASEFITTTDFTGASNIYTSGDNVYIIGLNNGYPYVEKAAGGTNDFTRIYQQTDGTQFDHGVVYIANEKLYYYLMERGTGNAMPLHLQIIDLDIAAEAEQPQLAFPQSSLTVEEGYEELSFTVTASSPVENRTIEKVDLYVDGTFIRTDSAAPFVWGHNNKPIELLGLSAGVHTFKAVATDSEGFTGIATMQLIVTSNNPLVSFPQSLITVDEGYEKLSFSVDAISPDADRTIESVTLLINGVEIRKDDSNPYIFGHSTKPHETGAMGWLDTHTPNPNPFTAGEYEFTAIAIDSKGFSTQATMTVVVKGQPKPPVVSFPKDEYVVYEGYEKLGITIEANSPVTDRTVQSVTLYRNGELVRVDTKPIWNFGHSYAPYEFGAMGWLDRHEPNPNPLSVGVHQFTAVATDSAGLQGEGTMTLVVEEVPAPTISFVESEIQLNVGYDALSLSVNTQAAVSWVGIERVDLYLNGTLIRDIYDSPYTWGGADFPEELLGMAAGNHTLEAIVTDTNGRTATTLMNFIVRPSISSFSSEAAPYLASNLVDGDTSDASSWVAVKKGTNSVTLDLGETKMISGTKLWTTAGERIKYIVFVSDYPHLGFKKYGKHGKYQKNSKHKHNDHKSRFDKYKKRQHAEPEEQPTLTDFAAEGRYVKLMVLGDWPNINEFEVKFD